MDARVVKPKILSEEKRLYFEDLERRIISGLNVGAMSALAQLARGWNDKEIWEESLKWVTVCPAQSVVESLRQIYLVLEVGEGSDASKRKQVIEIFVEYRDYLEKKLKTARKRNKKAP